MTSTAPQSVREVTATREAKPPRYHRVISCSSLNRMTLFSDSSREGRSKPWSDKNAAYHDANTSSLPTDMIDSKETMEESSIAFVDDESVSRPETREGRNDGSVARNDVVKGHVKSLRVWKLSVVGAIGVATLAVSLALFFSAKNNETRMYESAYDGCATKVINTFQENVASAVSALESLSATITSVALEAGSVWPNVTIPYFELEGNALIQTVGALSASFSPIILSRDQLSQWEAYASKSWQWLNQSFILEQYLSSEKSARRLSDGALRVWSRRGDNGTTVPEDGPGPYVPIWQISPPELQSQYALFDQLSQASFMTVYNASIVFGQRSTVTEVVNTTTTSPQSQFFSVVFSKFSTNKSNVGFVGSDIPWNSFLLDLLPSDNTGVTCVLLNTCGQSFTYRINGQEADFVGYGDLHDTGYDSKVYTGDLAAVFKPTTQNQCLYSLRVYPSSEFESAYSTSKPAVDAVIVASVGVFILVVFLCYDSVVHRRQRMVMESAARSNAIVAQLFPSVVHERLFGAAGSERAPDPEHRPSMKGNHQTASPPQRVVFRPKVEPNVKRPSLEARSTDGNDQEPVLPKSAPIADFFPHCTVMFADIAGFTAWSSTREPSQVFILLETLYHSFDQIARRRGVFKVETIGDCYVAVTGLPNPRKDHAVVMARFAFECSNKMNELTKHLESTLGPDTGDLSIRVGLHSGPVTAGVLRGEKSRFQLFGDTVNTAARMESTGQRDRIHISQETADNLRVAGKGHWTRARGEVVVAKGKGEMKTFWLEPLSERSSLCDQGHHASSVTTAEEPEPVSPGSEQGPPEEVMKELRKQMSSHWGDSGLDILVAERKRAEFDKLQRLIDWNADVLLQTLKAIVAKRQALHQDCTQHLEAKSEINIAKGSTVLDEVAEVISMPAFGSLPTNSKVDPSTLELPSAVVEQLRDFVAIVASMYRSNPFHNFEHASHVTMSANKLLKRVVQPNNFDYESTSSGENERGGIFKSSLHAYTYGISSDPLTQFALLFSALVHDIDHSGVPNMERAQEEIYIAHLYRSTSVSEQNSVDLAWDLLMDTSYDQLRSAIYTTDEELKRFRQIVVNAVMATDILDPELQRLRRKRWDIAFHNPYSYETGVQDSNRKATIVIEHLIQASDVAHTMQHWHVYTKWNERLFNEMYLAYMEGRSDTDPSQVWYIGEIMFFDNYVIPLAMKLKECGVFGVSSDEYLNYAIANRHEWAAKGEEVVAKMVAAFHKRAMEGQEKENLNSFT